LVEEVSLASQLEVEETHLAEVLVLGEEVVEDALAPQLEVQEVQEAHLAEVLVLGEQVVEDAQGRLQIKVDNVFRSGLIMIIY
jgi:hypothetical protein